MRQVMERMHMEEVSICYGMTETSPVSLQTRKDDTVEQRTQTVGRVGPHLEVMVVDPVTYEPAVCADVEFGSPEARAFDDEHRKVDESARFSKSLGNYENLITATYVESFDAPFPTAFFDAAGQIGITRAAIASSGSAKSAQRGAPPTPAPARKARVELLSAQPAAGCCAARISSALMPANQS